MDIWRHEIPAAEQRRGDAGGEREHGHLHQPHLVHLPPAGTPRPSLRPARAQPAPSPGPFEPTSAWLSLSLSQAIDAVITSLADTMGVVQTQAETIAVLTAQLFKPYPYPYHQT